MRCNAVGWRWACVLPPLIMILAVFGVTGCSPDVFLPSDEDRDRNFQRARDAERMGDFEAAADHYERALDRNPRSPMAHLGFASLCEGPLRRYASAVYHYQRYLVLRPEDPRADDIRQRITNCTERLATTVPLVVRSETIARDLELLRRETLSLRSQVTNLTGLTTYWSNEVGRLSLVTQQQAQALSEARAEAVRAGRVPSTVEFLGPIESGTGERADRSASRGRDTETARRRGGTSSTRYGSEDRGATSGSSFFSGSSASTSGGARSHQVVRGETLSSIARQYGVSLTALMRANPRLEPRRLQPGTRVRIP